jgi:hypothetical protein
VYVKEIEECYEAWRLNVTRKEMFIEGESRGQSYPEGKRHTKRCDNYMYFRMERLVTWFGNSGRDNFWRTFGLNTDCSAKRCTS